MPTEPNLHKYLDEIILEVEKELEEETTSGDAAGYDIPGAFGNGRDKDKKKTKEVSTQAGYEIVNEGVINEMPVEVQVALSMVTVLIVAGYVLEHLFVSADRWSDYPSLHQKISKYVKNNWRHLLGLPSVKTALNKTPLEKGKKISKRDILKNVSKQDLKNIMRDVEKKGDITEIINEGKRPDFKTREELDSYYKSKLDKLPSKKKVPGGGSNYSGTSKEGKYNTKIDKREQNIRNDREIAIKKLKRVSEQEKPVRKNRWLELKNDESMHTNKKLAVGLKELKYQLREVEKFLGWYGKLKNINELDSDTYWKRTNTNIRNIKERIINIAKKLQEIEK